MILRLATLNDIPAIMQIIAEVVPMMRVSGNLQWDSNYPNPTIFRQDVKLNQLWVAMVNDTVAGVAAFTTGPEPEYAAAGIDLNIPAVVTHRLAVSPRFRGMGIAAALFKQAEVIASEKGINYVRTDTNVKNQATTKLFPSLGYVNKGTITLASRPGMLFYCYEKRVDM
ncbi:GNAT family N-acetyltransferase [Mucilaginibacter limnophilus]|uniref:GNAT family N-acetyltransferase n=1 Tax=Mucilaginibacter limnophilus TaxID=1932778 RepID=A0A3S2XZE5_9SPHI|nr:GNAT family N-acetyltransferase [Mucilaginibacter limnophilus]RVT99792.1 GNAT family N-acetyltransferase [Mucilaginibacter limnophilus]